MLKTYIFPFLRMVCFSALAKGVLLWLEEAHKIYVDRYIAAVIGIIETAVMEAPGWVSWVIVGSLGLVVTVAWEVFARLIRRLRKRRPVQNQIIDTYEPVSYGHWDSIDPLRVIDVAHLWMEEHPPGQGSNKVSERANPIFQRLHAAIEAGGLLVSKEHQGRGGSTRWVARYSLKKYASSIGEKPKFLFRESR